MKTLVIIPAYNEGENIERVVDRLITDYPQYDYLVVNDGSADNTADICKQKGYNFVSHPVNLGLAGAFRTGMLYAYRNDYDCAIQFDGDGQHDPVYIESMIKEVEAGNDIVIGSRFVTEKKPVTMRMIGNNLIEFCILITTGKKIKDPTSGMRMFSRKMIKKLAFAVDLGPEPDTVALLYRKGAKVKEIQVRISERIAGKSYLTAAKSINYMARMVISILFLQWFRRGN
ncbi:MAG: glycosyltransferase family 2 protein [Clostridia bacterium]|nr:glycosyltransferase family 2 protein [Clostridia bacterium]